MTTDAMILLGALTTLILGVGGASLVLVGVAALVTLLIALVGGAMEHRRLVQKIDEQWGLPIPRDHGE